MDFTGIDYLSYAFGWTSFFQGVSSIPVPPLAGNLILHYCCVCVREREEVCFLALRFKINQNKNDVKTKGSNRKDNMD